LIATIATIAGILGTSLPASASHDRPYHDQSDMIDDESSSNRATFINDPGPGNLLSWADILQDQAFYERWGMPAEFFQHAVAVRIVVPQSTPWASCAGPQRPALTLCADHRVITSPDHTVGRTFGADTALDVFYWNGFWIARACGNFVTDNADAAKVSFEVIGAPPRIEADQPTPLTVRAIIRNDGPASPIEFEDVMTVRAPADCAVLPERQAFRRTLHRGETAVIDFTVTATCSEPSYHEFTFVNDLGVVTPHVADKNLANNHMEVSTTIPVFDRSDVKVDGVFTQCDNTTSVDTEFSCTLFASLLTGGPHAPALSEADLALSVPADCVATPTSALKHAGLLLGSDATVVHSSWNVVCTNRSFHPVGGAASVELKHLHVEDPNKDNNSGTSGPFVVEVFEAVDLRIDSLDLTCERAALPGEYSCLGSLAVFNAGPADQVKTVASMTLSGTSGCTSTATAPESKDMTLGTNTGGSLQTSWSVVCPPATDAVLTVDATFRNAHDEPHAVDTAASADRVVIQGGIIDVKPRSFPSAVNPGKQGSIPVAVLSTSDFDAWAEVDRTTLRFGRTGIEDSLLRCGGTAEDVNDDGLGDLVCTFDAQLTGLRCGDTVAYLTAKLNDGTLFESVGDVAVVPCKIL